MDLTKLISLIQILLLFLVVFMVIFFVFKKNTLITPETTDIKVISTLILLFIITSIIKRQLKVLNGEK